MSETKNMSRAEKHVVMLNEMQETISDCAMRMSEFTDAQLDDQWFKDAKTDLISALQQFAHCMDKI